MLTIELATPRTRGAYWYNCEWNVEESNIKAAMENSSAKETAVELMEWNYLNEKDFVAAVEFYNRLTEQPVFLK